jgi:hypothetical protein
MYPPPLDPSQRRTGRVKFFNAVKGYGFIIPNATHHIMNEEGKSLLQESCRFLFF